ncbi:type 1 glutamine amidotransferase [Bacillus sp. JJ1503]|uniref:type 1 glutamine amidotransferase n=1 Tax=unclassified Bacillus (in: firmicutes) TaxID=185979 RepID=UPI002FFDC01C
MLKYSKKLIAISQRVSNSFNYNETRDCLDQEWTTLFEHLNIIPLIVPNKLERLNDFLNSFDIQGIILSGGNDISPVLYGGNPSISKNVSFERDKTEIGLINYGIEQNIPILGVCRGMQMLNVFFGGKIEQDLKSIGENHIIQSHPISMVNNIFNEWNECYECNVNSYHNQGILIENLGEDLEVLYKTNILVEALYHKKLPIIGIQWHPEREKTITKLDKYIFDYLFK